MLKKLLWKGQSFWQVFGALLGSYFGLLFLLLALQLYLDAQSVLKGSQSNYLVVHKKVNILGTALSVLSGKQDGFSEAERQELLQQSFAEDLAPLTALRCQSSISIPEMNFRTLLPLQAIDSRFVDIDTSDFQWNNPNDEVPIILSNDYLLLYNFVFAPSQGLPPFTPSTVGRLRFRLRVSGKDQSRVFTGRILGFSRRINSILAPAAFVDFANARFADQPESLPTQLLLKTDAPYSKDLERYLQDKNYQIGGEGLAGGDLKSLLQVLIGVLAALGGVLLLLALLLFVLNFQLMVAKASRDIQLLLQLGYTAQQLSTLLLRRLALGFVFVFVAALGSLWLIKWLLSSWLIEEMGAAGRLAIEPQPSFWVLGAALLLAGFYLLVNWQSIRKSVNRLA